MGISDDIKIKAKDDKPDLLDSDQNSTEKTPAEETDQIKDNTVTEIPIDRSGTTPPVYEDIFSDHEEPFAHLKKSIDTIDTKEQQPQEKNQNNSMPQAIVKKNKKRKWPVVVIILVIVAAGAYIFFIKSNLFKDSSKNSDSSANQNQDSGVQIVSGQDYTRIGTEQEEENSQESEPENTPSQSTAPATTTPTEETPVSLDKSAVQVKVLNGNGISGSAATVQKILVDNGFIIDGVSNASNFNYESTTIYYNTGKSPEAELIKGILSGYTVTMFENPQVAGKFDVIVVVGKK
ncbi:MAG: hypothetical protein BWY19_00617 [bacterium ADurb.Bin212]|nr:MAG: hypothetical protein BWY19_00617 [bacterium ADurb.Bin212]